MANVVASHITDGTSAGSGSFATNSISPISNRLYLVYVAQFISGSTPNQPTLTGAGMTWDVVVTSTTTDRRITIFRGLNPSPGSGALTITTASQNPALGYSIDEFQNIDITGTNGTNAVVQSAANSTAGGASLTVNLSTFANASNATYCGIQIAGGSTTPEGGYTALVNTGTNRCVEFLASNDTTPSWTAIGASPSLAAALEIKFAIANGASFLLNFI